MRKVEGLERLVGRYYGPLAWVSWLSLVGILITAAMEARTSGNRTSSEDDENCDVIDLGEFQISEVGVDLFLDKKR